MHQQPRALHVLQELNAQTVPQVRAFDQSRNVGHHEGLIARADYAKIGFQSSKWIVGDFGPRRRDARDQSGFAGVGKPDESHVSQQLQLQTQLLFFAWTPRLVLGGRLMGGCSEMLIPAASLATLGDHEPLPGLREIVRHLARGFVVDDSAHRHRNVFARPFAACTLAAFAVPSALGLMLGIKTEMQQRVVVLARHKNHVAATSTVAAAGSAARDKLLPPERKATIATVARLHADSYFINKHGVRAELDSLISPEGATRSPFR